jgi:hypothetical protein
MNRHDYYMAADFYTHSAIKAKADNLTKKQHVENNLIENEINGKMTIKGLRANGCFAAIKT